ncbi:MAG: hypothetical protein EA393_03745 [Bacteroidetes bacterium]|nr:MAG: hypothetical protein EA393_03745 [Bacteroidota bacterium]
MKTRKNFKNAAFSASQIKSLAEKMLLMPFIVSLFLLGIVSCDRGEEERQRLQEENRQLKDQLEVNHENIESYFTELNQIEENLRLIKEREEVIAGETSRDLELGISQQDRINQDIKLIGELMEKNRLLIANLNNRVRNSDQRIAGFEQMVARLNQSIEEKEIEIHMLRDQLSKMNLQVDFLTARVDTLEREREMKSRMLEQQILEMNTAWFAMGSRRELIDNNVISREGGFLGIGRTNRLKSELNTDFFTRLDISRDFEITIAGENPELISSHPPESYEFIADEGELILKINSSEKFWGTTKHLVIQIR